MFDIRRTILPIILTSVIALTAFAPAGFAFGLGWDANTMTNTMTPLPVTNAAIEDDSSPDDVSTAVSGETLDETLDETAEPVSDDVAMESTVSGSSIDSLTASFISFACGTLVGGFVVFFFMNSRIKRACKDNKLLNSQLRASNAQRAFKKPSIPKDHPLFH